MGMFTKQHTTRRLLKITFFSALLLLSSFVPVNALEHGSAELFAVLPEGSTGPEGLTVGPDGNVYVTTFGFGSSGPVSTPARLLVYAPDGTLLRNVSVANASPHLIGLAFNPLTKDLIVLDFINKVALKVDPVTGASSLFMTITGNAILNGLTFDKAGNVYVSDSIQGIIWKTGPAGGAATAWVSDPLLMTTGFPPFGANGIEFNHAGDALFVANTGSSTLVKIPVINGNAGKPELFVNSAISADGIAIDASDNIWVAENQADQILVVDPSGKAIGRFGSFQGVTRDGIPKGLLFPASPAFSPDGTTLYVSNLALDVRTLGLTQTVDSQWTAQVKLYTISKIAVPSPSDESTGN